MTDLHFPILGTEIPKMHGRKIIMDRLWNDLTKKNPSHLTIVGPRYSGKSVLLKALEENMSLNKSPYKAVIYLDLGHQTPQDDQSFLKRLCESLGNGIKNCSKDYSEHLLAVEENEYDELREVISALEDEEINILMLWDGFDKVLSKGRITRNLWDQLRELASNRNFRLVTATRKKLQELIRSEESATSDFWNVFDMTPVKVDGFNERDVESIMSLSGLKLSTGARTEIENATSLYPPLFLELLNQLISLNTQSDISNDQVRTIVKNPPEVITSILMELWRDCSRSSQELFRQLTECGELLTSDVGVLEKNELVEKGFIKQSGNKTGKHCRLLENYIATLSNDTGSMTRLFSQSDEYENNISSVLELRLNQLGDIDNKLKKKIQRLIEDIPNDPEDCIENIRGIIDRSLDLIWLAEFGEKKEIPTGWFNDWKVRGERIIDAFNNKFPHKRGHQIGLLHLITGTANSGARAKCVTKNTYVLASSLQGFGDFGQHLDGEEVPIGVAVSAIMLSIELASLLAIELGD